MKRATITVISIVLAALFMLPSAWGQFTPFPAEQLRLVQGGPSAPQPSVSQNLGNGSDLITYYVVANFPRGAVASSPVVLANVGPISAASPVQISWPAVNGATNYDVLKVVGGTALPSTCTCSLVSATTTRNLTDTGQALNAYTLGSPIPTVQSNIQIDNTNQAFPVITVVGPQSNTPRFLAPAIEITEGFAVGFTTNGQTTAIPAGGVTATNCVGAVTAGMTNFMPFLPPGGNCADTTGNFPNQLLIPGPTVISNLQVTAVTGGSTATTGIVTVRVSGVDTGLSCTIGTGTSCSNTTDLVRVSGGQQVTVVVVSTVGGDTLADMRLSFMW